MFKTELVHPLATRRNREIYQDDAGCLWEIFEPLDGWQLDLASQDQGYFLVRLVDGSPERLYLSEYLKIYPGEMGEFNHRIYTRMSAEIFCHIFQQGPEYSLTAGSLDIGTHLHTVYRGTYNGQGYEMLVFSIKSQEPTESVAG